MPVRDPAASGGDGVSSLDGQLRGGLAQRANDAGGRPVHRAVRRDAIDHQTWNTSDWTNSAALAPRLIHVLGPAAQLLEVLIDARVGGTEFVLCSAAPVHGP